MADTKLSFGCAACCQTIVKHWRQHTQSARCDVNGKDRGTQVVVIGGAALLRSQGDGLQVLVLEDRRKIEDEDESEEGHVGISIWVWCRDVDS